jgi:hypothetical protein
LTADQRQIAGLKSTRNDIALSAQLDKADATYRVGDKLGLTVTATADVYLTVLTVGSSGRVSVLAPNAHQKLVHARAREPVSIPAPDAPYAVRVGGPPGFELINIIATTEPVDLLAHEPSGPAGAFRSLEAQAGTLARSLPLDLERMLQKGYVVAVLAIRVIDPATHR